METPPEETQSPAADERGIIATLRDPITIVLIVSSALLVIVYYHGPDIRFLPDWAQMARLNWFGLNFICLFIVPWILAKYVLKRSLRDLGLRAGDWRLQLKFGALFGGIVIPAILIASRMPGFQFYYGRYTWAYDNLPLFIIFMAGWALYFFAWEFFFRGFLLQVLGERFGPVAIVLQTLPFVMMHFGKPETETWSAIIAGMALGWWAWRTKSFIGPWVLHWLSSAVMIVAVLWWP